MEDCVAYIPGSLAPSSPAISPSITQPSPLGHSAMPLRLLPPPPAPSLSTHSNNEYEYIRPNVVTHESNVAHAYNQLFREEKESRMNDENPGEEEKDVSLKIAEEESCKVGEAKKDNN